MIWLPVIACVLHLRLPILAIVVVERRARPLHIPIFPTLAQNVFKKILYLVHHKCVVQEFDLWRQLKRSQLDLNGR